MILHIDKPDVEELIQLLSRDDVPVDHWPLADRLVDRLDAALQETFARPRRPFANSHPELTKSIETWAAPLREMGGYHHDG